MQLKYWSKNEKLLNHPQFNPTFREILLKTPEEFNQWILDTREFIIKIWDEEGIPPLNGKSLEELEQEFKDMANYPVSELRRKDELDGQNNVIINPTHIGSATNQFFPTMMKAKLNYSSKLNDMDDFNGYSVYDLFKEDKFKNRMITGGNRHFRRDSFYKYSSSIEIDDVKSGLVPAKTGFDWARTFHDNPQIFEGYGYWLCEIDNDKERKGSGYTEVSLDKFLWLSKEDICYAQNYHWLSDTALANIQNIKDTCQYHIRLYKNDTRIFPGGFMAYRIGYASVAMNFPPLVAKFLYQKYTEHIKGQNKIILYDPSSGWGGRITGAMCLPDKIQYHYVGTDPNTDNYLTDLNLSRYEYVAGFINDALSKGNLTKLWMGANTHTYELFQSGSEDISKLPRFEKYKGQIDLIFTSPPYFSKEFYSDDPTQSAAKFNTYSKWVEGFLRPTLTTCVEYLKKDRYLIWNIADVKMGVKGSYLPLEQDSRKILEGLGMKFVGIEKMALASMPGANRMTEEGIPSCKNFCKIDGKFSKMEPIFLYYKEK